MRRLDGEGGAIAIIVALCLVMLTGFAGLVVDIGRRYFEIGQLQTAADAGAWAIAERCAALMACPDATAASLAPDLANLNSEDGASSALVEWPTSNSVRVIVSTRTPGAPVESWLPNRVAGVFGGGERGFARSAVASWGAVGGGATVPIAICNRAWEHHTENGTRLPSGPPAQYIGFAGPAASPSGTCENPSSDTYSGGFGFLRRTADCMAVTTAVSPTEQWAHGTVGNNPNDPASACSVDAMYAKLQRIIDGTEPGITDSTVMIPIFDSYNSSTRQFHIAGYGAFRLMGYDITGGPGAKRYAMTATECMDNTGSASASCLKGYFTELVTPEAFAVMPGGGFGSTTFLLSE